MMRRTLIDVFEVFILFYVLLSPESGLPFEKRLKIVQKVDNFEQQN